MSDETLAARDKERVNAAFDMAGVIAQLVLSDAVREGRVPDRRDYVTVAMDLVTAAYSLAKMGGPEGVRDYSRLVRSHVESVEGTMGA